MQLAYIISDGVLFEGGFWSCWINLEYLEALNRAALWVSKNLMPRPFSLGFVIG